MRVSDLLVRKCAETTDKSVDSVDIDGGQIGSKIGSAVRQFFDGMEKVGICWDWIPRCPRGVAGQPREQFLFVDFERETRILSQPHQIMLLEVVRNARQEAVP